jgi:hypothetical protein
MILVFIWLPHIEAQVALQINFNYISTKPKSSENQNTLNFCQKNKNTLHPEIFLSKHNTMSFLVFSYLYILAIQKKYILSLDLSDIFATFSLKY